MIDSEEENSVISTIKLIEKLDEIHEKLKKLLYMDLDLDSKKLRKELNNMKSLVIVIKDANKFNINLLMKLQLRIERINAVINDIIIKEKSKSKVAGDSLNTNKYEKILNKNVKIILIYLYNQPENLARTTNLNALSYLVI